MHQQINIWTVLLYEKWKTLLLDIRYRNFVISILSFLAFFYNEKNIADIIEIFSKIVEQLKLSDKIVEDKIILIKIDLLTIWNCRYAIYWWEIMFNISPKFFLMKLVARLIYLKINLLSILFYQSLDIVSDIISLNRYTSILIWKYITKIINNNHFYHFNNPLQTVLEVLVIILYIYWAKYSIIDFFCILIKKFDQFYFIENIEKIYLGISKVHSI